MDAARDNIQAYNAYFEDNPHLTKRDPLATFFKREGHTSQKQEEHHKRVEKRARDYALSRRELRFELGSKEKDDWIETWTKVFDTDGNLSDQISEDPDAKWPCDLHAKQNSSHLRICEQRGCRGVNPEHARILSQGPAAKRARLALAKGTMAQWFWRTI